MGKGMTKESQITAFRDSIGAVVDRFSSEFDLTCIEMIGVLEEAKFWILLETADLIDEEEVEDEDSDGEGWKSEDSS